MNSSDLSFVSLVMNASVIVKCIMAILGCVSFMSWYWIFRKGFALRATREETSNFEQMFWSGIDLVQLYRNVSAERETAGSMARIFEAGFREFSKLHGQKTFEASDIIDGSRRAMRATFQREIDDLEAHLSFLASVGSVSPYVGLFGTVWGIMNAFRGLADVGTATLAHVAPGIAEALVATAIGLFAAIPAVVAYNRFIHDVDRLSIRFESFMEEFSNILQRQLR